MQDLGRRCKTYSGFKWTGEEIIQVLTMVREQEFAGRTACTKNFVTNVSMPPWSLPGTCLEPLRSLLGATLPVPPPWNAKKTKLCIIASAADFTASKYDLDAETTAATDGLPVADL